MVTLWRSQAIDYGVALDLGVCFRKREDKGCHVVVVVVVFDEAWKCMQACPRTLGN
jgi:hypothetical protein